MRALIERARVQQYHVLVGAIDSTNQASCALHEKLGFTHAGTVRQAGFKLGRWLDVAFYQLLLDTPDQRRWTADRRCSFRTTGAWPVPGPPP